MQMVDMARKPEKTEDMASPVMIEQSIYPYGLSISLTQDELEKLDLQPDCQVGDMIHIAAMAKVTSISQYETTENSNCRIELQITHMALEDEDKEEVAPKPRFKIRPEKFYKD